MATSEKSKRLLALDILRGITIAGMLLVNNPGSWSNIYPPLAHAPWNGLTPTDLVFPFFMFIMGVSTFISMRKFNFEFSGSALWKVIRRTVVIFLIGIAIAWFGRTLRAIVNGVPFPDCINHFDTIRILGVMPRLALCYCAAAIVAMFMKHKYIPALIALILVVYSALLITGHGFEFSKENIIYIVDHKILGENHLYTDTVNGVSLSLDPEGLLSTLPAIAHVLIGFMAGLLIMNTKDNDKRIEKLFILGTLLTFAGFLMDYGLPINKKIWSPSYVLVTCGLASSLLAILIWVIDIKGYKKWCKFFEAFGINPLFLYVLGGVLSIIIGCIQVPCAAAESGVMSLKGFIYTQWLTPLCCDDKTLASLIFALLFVGLNWCVGYVLYKKKIYIKI